MSNDESLSRQSALEADRFALFVSGAIDYAIYMFSPEGIIESWNAGAERFKGYKADEILGKHFSTFYTAEDIVAGAPEKAISTAIMQGKFEDEGWRWVFAVAICYESVPMLCDSLGILPSRPDAGSALVCTDAAKICPVFAMSIAIFNWNNKPGH